MYCLAMYDVQGKQSFIFRTNRIKEIVGASKIIESCFDMYLFPSAKEVSKKGIYNYGENEYFSDKAFKKRLEEGYCGEVIYNGGGNFLVLYENVDTCIKINQKFTFAVLKNIGTLKVLCSYVEVDDSLSNYKEDSRRLYACSSILESEESVIRPVNSLPIVQVDRRTTFPLSATRINEENEIEKISLDSFAKYQHSSVEGNKLLDDLVKKKGEDSLLAVIFIDGNNMGAKVQTELKDKSSDYTTCINALRDFSAGIQNRYVVKPKKAIQEKLDAKANDGESHSRMIVFAGDEMSFICKAEDAWDAVNTYFNTLDNKEDSSCAGVAVFHSHAPYADAYHIAEECCENAKKKMKRAQEKDTRYIDFQYLQGGLGMDLKTIRNREVGDIISKPWLIGNVNDYKEFEGKNVSKFCTDEVLETVRILKLAGGRSNIKGLVQSAKISMSEFDLEMDRIYGHHKRIIDNDEQAKKFFLNRNNEERRKLVYDIGIVYDLWFR